MDNSEDPTIKKVFDEVSNVNDYYEHTIIKSIDKSHTKGVDSGESNIYLCYGMVDNYINYDDFKDVGLTDFEMIGHELKHSFNLELNKTQSGRDPKSGIKYEEINAVIFENRIRVEEGEQIRTKYDGNDIPKEYLK